MRGRRVLHSSEKMNYGTPRPFFDWVDTAFGFTVFLIFLLFTVQVLFGLYARTTVTAVAADLATLGDIAGRAGVVRHGGGQQPCCGLHERRGRDREVRPDLYAIYQEGRQ